MDIESFDFPPERKPYVAKDIPQGVRPGGINVPADDTGSTDAKDDSSLDQSQSIASPSLPLGQRERIITPSQAVNEINYKLKTIDSGWIEGEIQGYKGPSSSGHCYFTITDENGTGAPITIWRGAWAAATKGVKDQLEDGRVIQAYFGKVELWKRGNVSFHVNRIRIAGKGELLARAQKTLSVLEAEGLTDNHHKQPLPWLPQNIGIIAGQGSDALADVKTSIKDRWPYVNVIELPAAVQGINTVASIIDRIGQAQDQVDVLVIARGGGSAQDLAPFDDERLCRAIFACKCPVLVAVGHTPDRPNVYAVADAAADVPGKSGAMLVPDWHEIQTNLQKATETMSEAANCLANISHQLDNIDLSYDFEHLEALNELELSEQGRKALGTQQMALSFANQEISKSHIRLRALLSQQHINNMLANTFALAKSKIKLLKNQTAFKADVSRLQKGKTYALDEQRTTIERTAKNNLERNHLEYKAAVASLEAYAAAQAQLQKRGYALITDADGAIITSIEQVEDGQTITVELANGYVQAKTLSKESKP